MPTRSAQRRVPGELARSFTHAFGLADTIELARELDRLRPRLTVYGIEAKDVSAGNELSAPVRAAVEAVRRELASASGSPQRTSGNTPMPPIPAWPSLGSMDSLAPIGSYLTPTSRNDDTS